MTLPQETRAELRRLHAAQVAEAKAWLDDMARSARASQAAWVAYSNAVADNLIPLLDALDAAEGALADCRDTIAENLVEAAKREDRLDAAEAERDDAVSALRALADELVLAGFPGGDRVQTLANVRALRADRDRLLRAVQWCRPRLKREGYGTMLDRMRAGKNEPDMTPIVASAALAPASQGDGM